MSYRLEELIDIGQFQALQDRLHAIYAFPSAIIDNEGAILTATGWQDICTKFHRVNSESEKECIKSDQYISDHLHEANPAVSYRCPHGLIDNATPIIIEGVHYGNFFTGQFFLEAPDLAVFGAQARKYGFGEKAYLEAVKKVPVWTAEQLNSYLFFIKGLIEVIAAIGLKNLRESESRRLIQESEQKYQTLVDNLTAGVVVHAPDSSIVFANAMAAALLGLTEEQLLGKTATDAAWCFLREDGSPLPLEEYPVQRVIHSGERLHNLMVGVRRRERTEPMWLLCSAYPVSDANGRILQAVVIFSDVTGRKQLEEALLQSEARYRRITEGLTDYQYAVRVENGRAVETTQSPACEEVTGYTAGEFAADTCLWIRMVVPEDGDLVRENVRQVLAGKHVPPIEHRIIRKSGETIWVSDTIILFKDAAGNLISYDGVIKDISARKGAEEQIKRALQEKTVMLKEIHHRVKNNMQVIDSLLSLQAKTSDDKTVRAMFEESRNRIRSMTLIHEKLYQSADMARVDFKDYLQRLVRNIADNYQRREVRICVAMEPVALDVNVGIPCGLIVNELVSNCFKHAFPGGRPGTITLGINKDCLGVHVLAVADDGVGFPEKVDFRNTESLGLQLITVLARQIHGTVELEKEEGTKFRVTFPGAPGA